MYTITQKKNVPFYATGNFLLQKNTACQAVFTALTSGIEVLNIVISNKLVGLFVVVVVDGIHLI